MEWRNAGLSRCPLHPHGGCSLCRHGSYKRLTTPGVRVARWYCPKSRRTFSLLPDFLAARFPGRLTTIEDAVIFAGSARSVEAAADFLRGLDISLPSAVRWLRRRIGAVRASIEAAAVIAPQEVSSLMAEATARRDSGSILLRLRAEFAAEALARIPAPLGFRCNRHRNGHLPDRQHDVGPDPGCDARYAAVPKVIQRICSPSRPISLHLSYPHPKTYVGSGVPIDV
jgi:transposase-like protein